MYVDFCIAEAMNWVVDGWRLGIYPIYNVFIYLEEPFLSAFHKKLGCACLSASRIELFSVGNGSGTRDTGYELHLY